MQFFIFDTLSVQICFRIFSAVVLGAAIGAERQWRNRGAGLRTNALVALGAALYVSVDEGLGPSIDRSRIAAQVVSGIGFLGAGVILRDGRTVRGLNTAATLWCSAAVGLLAGAGLTPVAFAGTTAVILTNTFLRPVARRVQNLWERDLGTPELAEEA